MIGMMYKKIKEENKANSENMEKKIEEIREDINEIK